VSAALALMLGVFVGIALLRGPIGLAMIAGGIAYLAATGRDLGLAAEQILNSLFGSFVLIAVPMFIFAANVMNAGSLSERIYALAHALMGRFRGGLAQVNVLASVIFSGMSGSAIADAVGPGMVEIEMMAKGGRYPRAFAVAVSAASATIGPIIPPSIPMVLYALVSGASVGALFLGGVVPGLLMAAAMMAVIVWIARRRGFPMEAPMPWHEIPRIFLRTLLPLLMPVVLLGGIYSGAFTPTEAAAVAALYALALALFVYRALDWKGLLAVVSDSARSTATVGVIVCGAFLFNYVLATEQIPARIAAGFAALELGPLGFLLVANVVFLVLGCLLDTTTLLLVMVPLLLPVAKALGVDLVHFGVVVVVNMMIGLLTPPYGVLLFVLSGLAGTPVKDIVRELLPFLVVLVAVLFLITLVPALVLALPRLAGYLG
jgi:tripartite ATP-independent transporter DctM subunit